MRSLSKPKVFIVGAALCTAVGIIAFMAENPSTHTVDNQLSETTSQTSQVISATGDINVSQNPPEEDLSRPEEPDSQIEDNFLQEKEVKVRLAQVADFYAEQIKYPTYSMPIQDEIALKKYLPNRNIKSSLPINPKQDNGPTISLLTDKQQYFKGENIIALVSADGVTEPYQVHARLIDNGKVIATATGIPSEDDQTTQQILLPTTNSNPTQGNNLRLVASFTINEKTYEIGTPITYVDSVASVISIEDSYIDSEYLVIPVNTVTTRPGYHEITANLYSQDNEQPLIHLTAQKELATSQAIIPLKAHIQALKNKGHEGPYLLRDVSLTRMPSPPNFVIEYGQVSASAFPVNGFAFDRYNDEPYVDEEAQSRLAFLRSLGANN